LCSCWPSRRSRQPKTAHGAKILSAAPPKEPYEIEKAVVVVST
jgi:hypothetical protein